MPVLKEYAESNEKDGYYVLAPISSLSHPIPLQIPEVTKQIYEELGYRPKRPGPDGGVDVPNELTWALHSVGLHWTERSGPQGNPTDLDPDHLRDEAGPELTDEDIETIVSFAEKYNGSYQTRVKNLREKFADSVDEEDSTSETSEAIPFLQDVMDSLSEDPSFSDYVDEMLDRWEPKNVVDDDYEPEDHRCSVKHLIAS